MDKRCLVFVCRILVWMLTGLVVSWMFNMYFAVYNNKDVPNGRFYATITSYSTTGSEAGKIENGEAGARNDLEKVHKLLMTFEWAATRSAPPLDPLSTPELHPKPLGLLRFQSKIDGYPRASRNADWNKQTRSALSLSSHARRQERRNWVVVRPAHCVNKTRPLTFLYIARSLYWHV